MKRLLRTLLVAILIVVPFTFASAKTSTTTTPSVISNNDGVVTMYVFYGDGCSHCAALETFIKTSLRKNEQVKDKFKVVYYEVWNKSGDHSQNIDLFKATGAALNYNPTGVPFYVIGNEYFSGFGESQGDTIVNTILDQSSNGKYVDVVGKLIEALPEDKKPVESNPEASIAAGEDEKTNNTDVVGFIILGITVVVVLVICFTKDKDVEETPVKEVKETKKEEPKKEVKKDTKKTVSKSTATKKTTAKKTTKKTTTKKSTKKK